MVNFLLYPTLIICFTACIIKKSSQQRYIKNRPVKESILKTDGYYYVIKKVPYNTDTITSINTYFFYKNGKVLYSYDFNNYTDMILKEDKLLSSDHTNLLKDTNAINLTNYEINKDSIVFERIVPERFYPHYLFIGHIINDSTFVITKRKGVYHLDMAEKKIINLNDTFHFRHFYPKPVFPNE